MQLNTPHFWRSNGILSNILKPLSYLYATTHTLRHRYTHPFTAERPVICIGNVTAGGAGKTPVAIALSALLIAEGKKPAFLSRGYGGNHKGPHLVNPEIDTAQDVGDEPLLLSNYAPAWVSHDRIKGAEAAIAAGADVIIMDDGFQNPTLKKDFSLLVIDGHYGLGNGHVLPAGPLRETLENALKRAQAVVIIGQDSQNIAQQIPSMIPLLFATLEPTQPPDLTTAYVAFAGIGNPDKFFTTLKASGCNLTATQPFPDHYPFTPTDIASLRARATALNARLITTEKDWVRIPNALREGITYMPVAIRWQEEEKLARLLHSVM